MGISECCDNFLRGITNGKGKEELSDHKTVLRKLADKSVPVARKRRILKQKGGFFLAPLLGVLGPLLLNAVSKIAGSG